ncbi:MAG: hypothetical protein WC789_05190 [Lentisphaeria bacterium]|jgi:collagenase-like PrtC family protease
MKFSVGYQFFDETGQPFSHSLCRLAEHVEEVYFPWLDSETCRASLINQGGKINWDGQAFLENDLGMLRQAGIKLNLLFNANCHGGKAVSQYLGNYVRSVIEHIREVAGGLECVTTASPFIAKVVKTQFPDIKTRASVNMRIGDVKGMQYLGDRFDGYYLQRDFNRNLDSIRKIKSWTDRQGKTLHLLANSGCLRFCSGQTFHDNAVAHEKEIQETKNLDDFNPFVCWNYYGKPENWVSLLQNTWIRPEDVHHYEGLFPAMKLATRMSARPLSILQAYIAGKYRGNLLDLLEPNHSKSLGQHYISNAKFPADWFEKTTGCTGECQSCGYCKEVLAKVLLKADEIVVEESSGSIVRHLPHTTSGRVGKGGGCGR